MDKYIKDGKVAILYSPGYGSGWFTWNKEMPELIFDPTLAKMVEDKAELSVMEDYVEKKYDIYHGALENLTIRWLPVGTPFKILESDGHECVLTPLEMPLIA